MDISDRLWFMRWVCLNYRSFQDEVKNDPESYYISRGVNGLVLKIF